MKCRIDKKETEQVGTPSDDQAAPFRKYQRLVRTAKFVKKFY